MRISIRRYLFRLILCVPTVWLFISLIILLSNDDSGPPPPHVEKTTARAKYNVNPLNALNLLKKIVKYEPKSEQPHVIHDNREQVIAPDLDEKKNDLNGPGEMGKPVIIDKNSLLPVDLDKYEKGFQNHAFNEYVSDLISKHRSLPDVRDSGCRQFDYKSLQMTASVVMCFHNEAWSTLLRSLHSLIDRSPSHLLKEIILVDDFSDMGKQKCLFSFLYLFF
jgi:hypothetical protein